MQTIHGKILDLATELPVDLDTGEGRMEVVDVYLLRRGIMASDDDIQDALSTAAVALDERYQGGYNVYDVLVEAVTKFE